MFEDEIFEGKNFSDLLKEIHTNSRKKDKQINSLIAQLQPLVKNITDATILVPLIKDYIDAGIKNDDALIKMASIIQRAQSRTTEEGTGFSLSDDEKKQLLDTVKETAKVEWEEEKHAKSSKK
jgi:hypothetical protein|tara:strand:+ start:651 stop:1019 length:369 start_codon:yes stop_codon:yes gene_type:complete